MCQTRYETSCSIYYAKPVPIMETIIDTQSNSSRDYKYWIIITVLLKEIKIHKRKTLLKRKPISEWGQNIIVKFM